LVTKGQSGDAGGGLVFAYTVSWGTFGAEGGGPKGRSFALAKSGWAFGIGACSWPPGQAYSKRT